ncbi:MAG TPA: glycerophosphodiester phosphodiesterase family protein [Gemmatimonadaceae bacterium]|nr:glycerophosphodiester phosphodiesterase family protein [Gemmatimonadaceae bacterium]
MSLLLAVTALPIAATAACHSNPFDPALAYGIASVRITPDSATISSEPSIFTLDGSTDLSVAFLDSADQPIPVGVAPVWTSSDESVALVSPLGTVVGVGPGRATITATVGSVRGQSTVTVLPAADTGIVIAAHRGFRSVYPENTVVAITGAFERGADAVEIDVQLTLDGVPVLMHDPTVDRTTNGAGAVSFMTLAEIRKLDACSKFPFATWPPCTVPTLREALESARGHGVLILDLKGSYDWAALESLVDLIHSEGMSQHVLVSSLNYQVLERLRQIDSVIPLGFFDWGIPRTEDVARLGRAVGMPEEHAVFADPGESSTLVSSGSSRRVSIMAWTVTNVDDARALVALGIRGIMTDVPLDKSALR